MDSELEASVVLVKQAFYFDEVVLIERVHYFEDAVPNLGFDLAGAVYQREREIRLAALFGFDLLVGHHKRGCDVLVLERGCVADVEVFHRLSVLYLISAILTIPKE